jgi:hypothetical protein
MRRSCSVLFAGAKFQPAKKMISTYTKYFSLKKNDPNSPDFEEKMKSKSSDFYHKFQ